MIIHAGNLSSIQNLLQIPKSNRILCESNVQRSSQLVCTHGNACGTRVDTVQCKNVGENEYGEVRRIGKNILGCLHLQQNRDRSNGNARQTSTTAFGLVSFRCLFAAPPAAVLTAPRSAGAGASSPRARRQVLCEGYRNSVDRQKLRGSCGLEYSLHYRRALPARSTTQQRTDRPEAWRELPSARCEQIQVTPAAGRRRSSSSDHHHRVRGPHSSWAAIAPRRRPGLVV